MNLPKDLQNIVNQFKEDEKYLNWKFLIPIFDFEEIVIMKKNGQESLINVNKLTIKNIGYLFDKSFMKANKSKLPRDYKQDIKDIKKNLKLIYLYFLTEPTDLQDYTMGSKYNKDFDMIRLSPVSKKWSNFVYFIFTIASRFKSKFQSDKKFKDKVHKKISSWISKSDLGKLVSEQGILDNIARHMMGGRCCGKTKTGKRCKNKCLKKRCHLHK